MSFKLARICNYYKSAPAFCELSEAKSALAGQTGFYIPDIRVSGM
jgi:hypothetical protein